MSSRTIIPAFFTLMLLLCVAACGKDPNAEKSSLSKQSSRTQGAKSMTIKITSSAFQEGQRIPKQYTGEGADLSPPLRWSDVPDEAKELLLICDDPDAPTDEPWVHWVIYKIPANVTSLKEGIPRKTRLTDPPGTLQGKNSWPNSKTAVPENIGYRGPMPPTGHGTHHYYFKLYALEAKLSAEAGMDKNSILKEIEGHVIAEGQLMGTYSR
jgi:Raf kinase inhibitor-like YbhB/YbcL family protein